MKRYEQGREDNVTSEIRSGTNVSHARESGRNFGGENPAHSLDCTTYGFKLAIVLARLANGWMDGCMDVRSVCSMSCLRLLFCPAGMIDRACLMYDLNGQIGRVMITAGCV